eukprot:gb/GECH01005710.1/.p1 GENE.gb/GECH01005710.1/~~gb/GECH01005710.1/.p1  ORF type:complete len:267 (+),score=55.47 gb/GECH01005710.1/:1-801(+)
MDFLQKILFNIDDSIVGTYLATALPPAFRPAYVVLGSIIIVLLIIFTLILGSKKRNNRNTTLILGLTDSGKTAMYHQLKDGKLRKTYASMRTNEGTFPLKGFHEDTSYHIVDIPGHPRLRDEYRAFIGEAGAIIYVVDAAEITRRDQENAQLLFEVMTNPQVYEHSVPIFVACNKSDRVTAYKKQSVQKRLEKELSRMASTRDAQLSSNLRGEGDDDIEEERMQLVNEGDKFRFSKSPIPVDFVEVSMKDGKGMTEIHQFISQSIE